MSLYRHTPHPRLRQRQAEGPVKTAAQHKTGSAAARFNTRLGLGITNAVGTMWTAYVFTLLSLVSLPAVLTEVFHLHVFPSWLISVSLIAGVAWVAQTFLQLVLLPIIMVGQNVQASAADARSEQTFKDAEAILQTAEKIQEHLEAQDGVLSGLLMLLHPGKDSGGGAAA